MVVTYQCDFQLLNIIQCLDTDVTALLNGAQDTANTVIIKNAYINDWKIRELIQRRCWTGVCEMVIIGRLIT